MRRLYQKIYLTIVVILVLVVAVSGAFWRRGFDSSPAGQVFELAGELAAALLPPADAPLAAQQQAIERLAERFDMSLALYTSNDMLAARRGGPFPHPLRERHGWVHGAGGPAWSVRLPDGRAIVARRAMHRSHPALGFVALLGTIALVIAIGAYPVVRGLTRRLERLQTAVETVGAGDLGARVVVQGRDEVAQLGESFNRAAARIEQLINAHRMLLANASHELRTPLSRLRLGIELMSKSSDPKYKAGLERDIAELDALIDEILLMSRLGATRTLQTSEDIDWLALIAEEGAHYDVAPQGVHANVRGDATLLRRLVRNLLENAKRHGAPPIAMELKISDSRAVLDVMDSGQGIPAEERERVFDPFYKRQPAGQGTGLGLALVRQIAQLHGGDVAVVPRPDAVSCFRVTLPLAGA
jgi:signal transduction histidine kinase